MEIVADSWLAGVVGQPVFRIVDGDDNDISTEALRKVIAKNESAFFYGKVDTKKIAVVRALTDTGMFVVDVNVSLGLSRNTESRSPKTPGLEVRRCIEGDREQVLRIAESTYEYSRFHLDPLFPASVANRIKREWTANYLNGHRGDRLFLATVEGKAVGFLAALTVGEASSCTAIIDLLCVDKSHRQRGIGGALVSAFIAHYRPQARRLEVGTQVANTPSLRLYEGWGFSIQKSQYVLHLHV